MGESAQTKRNKSSFIIKIYVIIIIKLCSFGCTSNDWAPSVIEQSEMVTALTANTNQRTTNQFHSKNIIVFTVAPTSDAFYGLNLYIMGQSNKCTIEH